MSNVWYELEIMQLDKEAKSFYPIALYNRSDSNAGFDVHASETVSIEQTPVCIPFGITVSMLKAESMPNGTSNDYVKSESHFFLMPRSSIYKSGVMMANSTGVIDKSYRGELKAPVWSMTGNSTVSYGDRLFQIVAPDMGWIRHVRLVESLSSTERGAKGFGSSGL